MLFSPHIIVESSFATVARMAKKLQIAGIARPTICNGYDVVDFKAICAAAMIAFIVIFQENISNILGCTSAAITALAPSSGNLSSALQFLMTLRISGFPVCNILSHLVSFLTTAFFVGFIGAIFVRLVPSLKALFDFFGMLFTMIFIVNSNLLRVFLAPTIGPFFSLGIILWVVGDVLSIVSICRILSALKTNTQNSISFGDMAVFAWLSGKVSLFSGCQRSLTRSHIAPCFHEEFLAC